MMLQVHAASPQKRGVNSVIYSQSSWTAGNPNQGTNYQVVDRRTVDWHVKNNINFLRMMFIWEWVQPTLLAAIPPAADPFLTYWNQFVSTVNYATSNGLYVLIEHFGSCADYWAIGSGNTVPAWKPVGNGTQTYTNQIGGANVTNAHFTDLYTRLATFFKNNPRVIFGMCNEPHNMSTMQWFTTAQAVINAIRATGATQTIYVPGNGYAGWDWTNSNVDTAGTPRSNAYGWQNAGGVGVPLYDPLRKLVASIHIYVDDAGGSTVDSPPGTAIKPYGAGTAANAAVDRLRQTTNWARPLGIKVHVSEIGMLSTYQGASACWSAFEAYCTANADVVEGFSWWGQSVTDPSWWANDETHFALGPNTDPGAGLPLTNPTGNFTMIASSFKAVSLASTTKPAAPATYTVDVAQTLNSGLTPYFVRVPSGYDSSHNTPYKLFVWSHGCGGYSSNDVNMVSLGGTTQTWISLTVGGAEGACWANGDGVKIMAAIEHCKTKFNIDPRKIFLGGYSSGGDIGYKLAFENDRKFAGVLFENTDPFLIGWGADLAYQGTTNKFQVTHLLHTSDGTYPRATVLASMTSLTNAGYPVTTIEKAGTHYDADSGAFGTTYDLQTFLLPYLNSSGSLAPP